MRPYDIHETELLRIARARTEELRRDWQAANGVQSRRVETMRRPRVALLRAAREAAGRGLISLGRRMLPVEVEPCG